VNHTELDIDRPVAVVPEVFYLQLLVGALTTTSHAVLGSTSLGLSGSH
jgi:hypothetical protein